MSKNAAFHQQLVADLNRLPAQGALLRRHYYCAHMDQVLTKTEQGNRKQILEENAVLYERNKGKRRDWDYPLRIPEYDYWVIKMENPHIWEKQKDGGFVMRDKEGAARLLKKVYERNPEYRSG